MRTAPQPPTATRSYRSREMLEGDVGMLQAWFDANPEYFLRINGMPPRADEARQEFDDAPPPHLAAGERWLTGYVDAAGAMAGLSSVIAHLAVPGVYQVGLFVIATRLHGTGAAQEIFAALEATMVEAGARWIRLNVVAGNVQAERFWVRQGFCELRLRTGIDTGGRINDVRTFVKPIGVDTVLSFLAESPRDRPGSTLP